MTKNRTDYKKLLEELKYYQENLNESNLEEFDQWKKEVVKYLDRGLRSKFNKLQFYHNELGNDEIPF